MENMSKDSAYNNQQPHERDSNPLCKFDVNVRLEKQDRVLIIEVYCESIKDFGYLKIPAHLAECCVSLTSWLLYMPRRVPTSGCSRYDCHASTNSDFISSPKNGGSSRPSAHMTVTSPRERQKKSDHRYV